jgi:filamentous hemagglutinin family protein
MIDVSISLIRGSLGLLLLLGSGMAVAAGPAGIKLDGTLGPSAAALAGPTYAITQNLGKLSGGNLYFSFQYFNVATGETALFSTTSAGINNVISRVTGGYASTIDGTIALQAASGAPNFFLINPSGVTFTANALINVPAAFYVSTANYLKFSDGNFYVDPGRMSTLSAAAPEAFGFLGTTRAPVNIEGANLSAGVNGAGDFRIAAGDVSVDGAGAPIGIQNTTGNIEVTAVGAPSAEVPLSGPFASTDGTVTIRNGGLLLTQGLGSTNGGAIEVNAGSLLIDGLGLAMNNAPFIQTGISTLTDLLGLGSNSSGSITVAVGNDARIINGGAIESGSFGPGNAGNLSISAKSLTIDGVTYTGFTGLSTATTGFGPVGFAGAAGSLTVTTAGPLTVTNGGEIASGTYGSGNGGALSVTAGSVSIDGGTAGILTGIGSTATPGSTGDTGKLTVTTMGALTVKNGGEIVSGTYGSGNSGALSVTAGSVSIDGGTADILTGIGSTANPGSTGDAGKLTVLTTGALTVTDGGEITSDTFGSGNAGALEITTTGAVTATNGGVITSATFGSGNAGALSVTAGSVAIDGGTSSSLTGMNSSADPGATGNAGTLTVTTTGALTLTNGGEIRSTTLGPGRAGALTVTTKGALTVMNGGEIVSGTSGSGNDGDLSVTAGSVAIDGSTLYSFTGIANQVSLGSTGDGGTLTVTSMGALTVTNGGEITSSTFGSGNAGALSVTAGSIAITGGAAGIFTGIGSTANPGSTGDAGNLTVMTTGALAVTNGGGIVSGTYGSGNAGALSVTAGSVAIEGSRVNGSSAIDSEAGPGSTGGSGTLTVTTTGALTVTNGGEILSGTYGSGNAGALSVTAGSVAIDGGTANIFTGIESSAEPGSTGVAGTLTVTTTGALTVTNGAEIASNTFGAGNAGALSVTAGSVSINGAKSTGIFCDAEQGSTGSAGSVTVNVNDTAYLLNGGAISSTANSGSSGQPGTIAISAGTLILGTGGVVTIENDATVSNPGVINPTQINIHARNVQMNGGLITAASTGNVAASGIDISYDSALRMDPSTISTSAVDGDGGRITITGQGPLFIDHSNITTSVTGKTNGNGGDITIIAPEIVLDTGAIQANTAAPLAAGGTVTINAQALLPSYQSFILGGNAIAFDPASIGSNVVQAAAPDGVSGALSVTVPTLDLGNALLGLTGRPSATAALGRGLCGFSRGSSLAITGRGGVAPSAYDPPWIDPEQAWQQAAAHAVDGAAATPASAGIHPLELFACR